jgi:hypothetical protein
MIEFRSSLSFLSPAKNDDRIPELTFFFGWILFPLRYVVGTPHNFSKATCPTTDDRIPELTFFFGDDRIPKLTFFFGWII